MQLIEIKEYCSLIHQFKESELQVHSLFKNTINFELNSKGSSFKLISIGTSNTKIGPCGLISTISNFNDLKLKLKVNDKYKLINNSIIGKNINFSFKLSSAKCTKVNKAIIPLLNELDELEYYLLTNAPKGGIYHTAFIEKKYAKVNLAIDRFIYWLNENVNYLSDIIPCLIGFGIGLTPSGDDFLLGILFVLLSIKSDKSPILINELEKHLYKTSDISIQMLKCGMIGHFSSIYIEFNLLDVNSFENIINYGHTSGHDFLSGVFFCIKKYRLIL